MDPRAALHRRRLVTAEFRRRHQSTCRLGSSRRHPPTWIFPLPAFALWIAPCRSTLTTPSRPTGTSTTIGRTRGRRDRLVRRTDGKRCLPTSTRSTNLVCCAPSLPLTDPSSWRCGKTKGRGGPQTDCSFFPGIPDPREVRPVISMALGTWSVCRKAWGSATTSLWRRTSTWFTQHGCVVLLNKDTFEPNYSCLPLFIPCKLRYATWAVEGMVVTGKSCSYFTVANVHINNECAERRSVCIPLRCSYVICASGLAQWCSLAISTKGAERDIPTWWHCASLPVCSEGQHRTSPLEAAFSSACVPLPTSGVPPLWRPGAELHGDMWPECCGFVVLLGSQREWLIMR